MWLHRSGDPDEGALANLRQGSLGRIAQELANLAIRTKARDQLDQSHVRLTSRLFPEEHGDRDAMECFVARLRDDDVRHLVLLIRRHPGSDLLAKLIVAENTFTPLNFTSRRSVSCPD
jgi:hypothetical protein